MVFLPSFSFRRFIERSSSNRQILVAAPLGFSIFFIISSIAFSVIATEIEVVLEWDADEGGDRVGEFQPVRSWRHPARGSLQRKGRDVCLNKMTVRFFFRCRPCGYNDGCTSTPKAISNCLARTLVPPVTSTRLSVNSFTPNEMPDDDVLISGLCRTAQNRTAGNGPEALKSLETLNSRQRSASAARVASA